MSEHRGQPIPQDKERFRYLTNKRAKMPEGLVIQVPIVTTRQLIRERREQVLREHTARQ